MSTDAAEHRVHLNAPQGLAGTSNVISDREDRRPARAVPRVRFVLELEVG